VLAAAAQGRSSYECREVLVAHARAMPRGTTLIAHYKDVASHLPDYYRNEAESALAQ
jgi:hypothetical protein